MTKRNLVLTAAFGLLAATPAFARSHRPHPGAPARTVHVTVGADGFDPAEVRVKSGENVNLVITRRTERTCATAVASKELGVSRELPLGTPVAVALHPVDRGTIRIACAMDMVALSIVVE